MASVAAPYGLRPVNLIGGQVFAGSTRQIAIASGYATNIFYGDIVAVNSSGVVVKVTTLGTAASQFGNGVIGVFLGCTYTDPNLKYKVNKQYWPTGTVASDAQAYICDDPDTVFQAQANGSVAQTALGNNIGVVQTTGSTTTGDSAIALDTTTINTTSTIGLRIVDFVNGPFSSVGDAYTDVLVKFNFGQHSYYNATGV